MEKINKLKKKFTKFNIEGYLIPKNDEFFSEYTPAHKDDLLYISNFSGSYGLALILKKNNYLFVDGRYTVQASYQSGNIFKIVNLPLENNKKKLNLKNIRVGYDPKLFNENFINQLSKKLNFKCKAINVNLVKSTKKNKISFKKENCFYVLDKSITGESCIKKIKYIKRKLIENNTDILLVTSSENIAWLLNIRGNDSDFSPIPNCFLIIDNKMRIYLFCDLLKINSKFRKKLKFLNILKIEELANFLKNIKNKKFIIDKTTCSVFYKQIVKKQNKIVSESDPIYFLKSKKNIIEINNMKKIHEYDGASLTKFLFWVKNNFKKKK